MADSGITARSRRAICAAMATVACMMSITVTSSAQTTIPADRGLARLAAANVLLNRYRSSHSLEDLRTASSTLLSANDFSMNRPEDLVARRRAVTSGYATILRELESLTDPTFDPSDPKSLPLMCVTPPREPSGRQLGSCVDPNDIQDPATRAAYLVAIDENAARTRRLNTQQRVHTLALETTDRLARVLRRYRSRVPDDGAAIDAILRQAGVSDARRATIEAAVAAPGQ